MYLGQWAPGSGGHLGAVGTWVRFALRGSGHLEAVGTWGQCALWGGGHLAAVGTWERWALGVRWAHGGGYFGAVVSMLVGVISRIS